MRNVPTILCTLAAVVLLAFLGSWAIRAVEGAVRKGLVRAPVQFDNQLRIEMSQTATEKTGTLKKTLNGTEVSMDYVWDCTAEGWKRILADWKIICDNPPGD